MNQYKQNEKLIEIGTKVSERLDSYETIIFLIFLVGLIVKIATSSRVDIIVILSLLTLGILYILNAYSPLEDDNVGGLENFVNKMMSISLSVSTIGILFILENWNGYKVFIPLGIMTLIILLLIIFILKSKKPDLEIFKVRTLLRIIIIVIVGLILYFTPKANLIKCRLNKDVMIERIN